MEDTSRVRPIGNLPGDRHMMRAFKLFDRREVSGLINAGRLDLAVAEFR